MSLRRNDLMLMVSLVPTICMAAPPAPNADTRALLSANPGLRATIQDGRLIALYGRGSPSAIRSPPPAHSPTAAWATGFPT